MFDFTVYITIHDQDLLLTLLKNNVFKQLEKVDYRFIFVGPRPVDKIESLDNVIVARNLPINIEECTKFCDFTAWYAIVKNNLVNKGHAVLIQYDSLLDPNFVSIISTAISKNPNAVFGFIPFGMNYKDLTNSKYSKCIVESLSHIYNIDCSKLIRTSICEGDIFWPACTSVIFPKEILLGYISWLEPLLSDLRADPYAAHSLERAIKYFCLFSKTTVLYIPNALKHLYLISHDQKYQSDRSEVDIQDSYEKFIHGKLNYRKNFLCNFIHIFFRKRISYDMRYKEIFLFSFKVIYYPSKYFNFVRRKALESLDD